MSDRIFYKLDPAGPTLACIKSVVNQRAECALAWEAFAVEHGAEEWLCNDWLLGVKLDDPDVDVWHNTQKLPGGVYKPRRVKGSMLLKEFNALPRKAGCSDIARRLGIDTPCDGRAMFYPSWEYIGGEVYLTLHEDVKHVPADATALKMSEWYALKEAEAQT